jgi:hypothetical protein
MAESNPTVTFVKQEEEQPSGGWNRPTTPIPPTVYDPHDDMHWSSCQDPYCTTHLDAKQNNNYFPGAGPANQPCNCGTEHDPELDAVIRAKHLNVRKACRAWGRGKRLCYDCGFLVNKEGHEERCSAANNIRSSPPDVKENEVPAPAGEDRPHHYEHYLTGDYEEMLYTTQELPAVLVPATTIPDGLTINLSLYQQAAGEAQGAQVGTLQCQDCDNACLEQMVRELYHITDQQRGMAQQVCRPRHCWIRRPFPKDRNGLVGASAWKGELLSQTTKTMLLGALIATAGLWIFIMTVAMGYVTFRV